MHKWVGRVLVWLIAWVWVFDLCGLWFVGFGFVADLVVGGGRFDFRIFVLCIWG